MHCIPFIYYALILLDWRERLAASDGINEKQEVLLKTCVVNVILITYYIARGSVTSCGYLHTIFAAVV